MRILITIVSVIIISSLSFKKAEKPDCETWKREAKYWEEMSKLKDSCILIMDFKTQGAKNKVLNLHYKMMELTVKYIK